MKEQFCDYEIALELKKKGFNEPCIAYYHNYVEPSFSEGILKSNYIYNSKEILYYNDCAAPLLQQVIDWMETKGIFISIQYAAPDTNKFCYRIDNYNHVQISKTIMSSNKGFVFGEYKPCGSYGNFSGYNFKKRIEATIAAIEYALTLI